MLLQIDAPASGTKQNVLHYHRADLQQDEVRIQPRFQVNASILGPHREACAAYVPRQ